MFFFKKPEGNRSREYSPIRQTLTFGMIRNLSLFLVSGILYLSLSKGVCVAQDVQVTSSFDKRTAHVNEEIHLTIRISGFTGNLQAPRLPALPDFDTFYTGRASQITFVNGQSTSNLEFNYVLIPKAAGRYTIPPIEVHVNNQLYRTDPIDIEILAQKVPVRQSRPPAAPLPVPATPPHQRPTPVATPPAGVEGGDENIFVRASVDKTTVYPNEQILLTYSLFTRYDTRYEGFEEEPQVSGFWIEEFPMEGDIARQTVRLNGRRYVQADIKKVALFPTTAAEYTIQPGVIKVSIREEPQTTSIFDEFFNDSFFSSGSFFAHRKNLLLKPPPIHISVKPLPEEGRPASFDGAVGNYRINATIDKHKVKQNEPITMKIEIEGEGNIETVKKPHLPPLEDFKIYDSDTTSQLFKTGTLIGGRKVFEIVFIPTKAGNLSIPSLEFSFFHVASRRYVTLKTPRFSIQVEPSDQPFQLPQALTREEAFKRDVKVEHRDIHYIKERLPSQRWRTLQERFFQALMAGNLVMTLLLVIGLVQARREQIFAKDSALKRTRLAKQRAEARIRQLKKMGRSSAPEATRRVFEEIDKALTQYLSDKFNLSAYGITRAELEQELERTMGEADPLFEAIKRLYHLCDEFRFGRGAVAHEHIAEALKIFRETIKRVEKLR